MPSRLLPLLSIAALLAVPAAGQPLTASAPGSGLSAPAPAISVPLPAAWPGEEGSPAGPFGAGPRPQAPLTGKALDLKENGLDMQGLVSAFSNASGLRMQVERIVNSRSSGVSGTLRLVLWATPTYPVFGDTINAFTLGSKVLGTLQAGFQFENVDTGFVPYTAPPTGCYYLTVSLQEFDSGSYFYTALRTLITGGIPDGQGHYRYSFGGASCQVNSACVRTGSVSCLQNGRFEVRVDYDSANSSGAAQLMSFNGQRAESDDSAFLYFFSPANFEMGLKILNGCGVNGRYWVFIGGLTNQGWTVNIRDTQTGVVKTYSNALNHLTSTVADTNALPCQ